MTISARCHTRLFTTAFALATISPSSGEEFVLEPFEGATGVAVSGSDSGFGWAGPWAGAVQATFGSGNTFIASGSNSVGTVASSADSCALAGGADLTRAFATGYTIGDDTPNGELPVLYFSFIVDNPGAIASGHEFRTTLLSGSNELITFGKKINRPWVLGDSDEELTFTSNANTSNLGTWFAVVKLEYHGTDTAATGYLANTSDSDLDLTDINTYPRIAAVTLTGKVTFDGVRINSHNTSSAKVDEIRIGDDLANVTATPDPLLVVNSSTSITVTNSATPISLPISSAGTSQDLIITSVTPEGPAGALISINSAVPSTLEAGETGNIDLTFTPTGPGEYTANLTIVSNDAATPSKVIELLFTVTDPLISVGESLIDFGSFSKNSSPQLLTVEVSNTGSSEDLVISGLVLTGAPEFTTGTIPSPIPAGESADIEIAFNPGTNDGFFSGSLSIVSNDFNQSVPKISLTAFVAPTQTIAAIFDFDPNQLAGSTMDLDGSTMAAWTTSDLTDVATGIGALSSDNQGTVNRSISAGATGNYLRFSSARESDGQTPPAAGGNDESTWTTFPISPATGGGPLGFNGGEAAVQTYAFNGITGSNETDWTLYFSVDSGISWTSLGTFAGASISTIGQSEPLELRWDLSPIHSQSGPVNFILDPVSKGLTNGTVDQRGTGFDNLYLTLGSASGLLITGIDPDGNGGTILTWAGAPGQYAIDYSLDLTAGSWQELTNSATILPGASEGSLTLNLPAAVTTRDRAFYRIRIAP